MSKISIPQSNIKSIEVVQQPDVNSFIKHQNIDITGAKIKIVFNDNSITTTSILPSMISGYNKNDSLFGLHTVAVFYGVQTASFKVSLDRFKEVSYRHRNYNHINALVKLWIINGYSDGTFKPTNNVTRAQFSTMINNAIEYSNKR